MAGKGCTGVTTNNAGNGKNARSYCEGRQASADLGNTSNNPHAIGSEASDAWLRGFNSYTNGGNDPQPQDCCSIPALFGS